MYPKEWVSGRRFYMGMASALDKAVGDVTNTLKSTGMWSKTLVVFSSDNGGPSLVGGKSNANNYPLRGGASESFLYHRIAIGHFVFASQLTSA